MADNERKIVTTFEANIDQFNSATQKLNADMKGINAQFNNATASMGKWSDSQDGLKAKLDQLNKSLKLQQNALVDSKKKFNDLVAQGKENSREAQQLAQKILQQETAVKKTEKAIDGYADSLKELEDAGADTRQELEKLTKAQEEAEQSASELTSKIGKGLVVGIGSIATACVGAIKGLGSIVENTKELRTEMGRIDVAFQQAGFSSETATKAYTDFNSILGDTGKSTETLQHLAMFAKTEEELGDYTNILTGIFAKFGNSMPTESIAEGINHTIQLGSVQGTLADALEWSGRNVDEFNEQLAKCKDEQERSQLIVKTLNELYGEAGTQYKEVNKDVIEANKAQTEYNNKMAEVGAKVQPAMNQFKLIMVEALTKVMDTFSQADLEGLMTNIANVIQDLATNVLPPLMNALGWILDNMNWLAPAIGGVALAIGSYNAVTKIMKTYTELAKIAQLGLNGALKANPIGFVITLISGLVTAFTILWNKSEGFRNFWKKVWDVIKTSVKVAWDFIKPIFEGIQNTFKAMINFILKGVNFLIRGLNKISFDVPDWVPAIGGKKLGFNIPEVPLLAKGGIIDRPTLAMVGEHGKEAVMPLENNTGWIDMLADRLADKMGNTNNSYNFNYTFEKMETTQLALHKAQLETKRLIGG